MSYQVSPRSETRSLSQSQDLRIAVQHRCGFDASDPEARKRARRLEAALRRLLLRRERAPRRASTILVELPWICSSFFPHSPSLPPFFFVGNSRFALLYPSAPISYLRLIVPFFYFFRIPYSSGGRGVSFFPHSLIYSTPYFLVPTLPFILRCVSSDTLAYAFFSPFSRGVLSCRSLTHFGDGAW